MQNLSKLATALLVVAMMSATAIAADKPFVKVNGVAVSQFLADSLMAEQKAQGTADTPELKNAVREQLIQRELLIQEAKKSGVSKNAEVAAQAEAARQNVLVRAYIQDYVKKNPISDAQLRAELERIKAQLGSTEYKGRHILVKEEAEAQAIIAKLKAGEKFEDLAKESIDPGSKENGGDLGWASPSNFVKPFSDGLTSLSKGQFTETPVKSEFGYHVIMLEDTRPLAEPPFDEIKPRLMQQAQAKQISKMIEDLRAKAKIE